MTWYDRAIDRVMKSWFCPRGNQEKWRVPTVHVCRIIFLYPYIRHYTYIRVRKMCARVMEWVIWPHEEPSGIVERTGDECLCHPWFIHLFMPDSRIEIHTSNTCHSNQASKSTMSFQANHPDLSSWFSSLHYSITALDSQDGRIIDSSASQSGQFVSIW